VSRFSSIDETTFEIGFANNNNQIEKKKEKIDALS